jgi:hypothetical protein
MALCHHGVKPTLMRSRYNTNQEGGMFASRAKTMRGGSASFTGNDVPWSGFDTAKTHVGLGIASKTYSMRTQSVSGVMETRMFAM